MSGIISIRDSIRDFIRKYDELMTPLFRFVSSFILFMTLNSLFGYSDFLGRGIVMFLLSVICALVTNSVVVFLGGIIIVVNSFGISLDVGILSILLFILIYCTYMRMFSHCSWILMVVPFLYMLKLQYAIPIIVGIFAGMSGIVPVAFGIVIYYFSIYAREALAIMNSATKEESKKFQGYEYIIQSLFKNKEMMLVMIVFAVVIVITFVIYRMSFDYSWYVAIGVGGVMSVVLFIVCGIMLEISVSVAPLILGVLVGVIAATLIQGCKSMADYSRKESVQFEDDDFFYYVKAIPKYNVGSKKKKVKKITEE